MCILKQSSMSTEMVTNKISYKKLITKKTEKPFAKTKFVAKIHLLLFLIYQCLIY